MMFDFNSHEEELIIGSTKKFATMMAAFFLVISLAPLLKHHPIRVWPLFIVTFFVVGIFLFQESLIPLQKSWMKLSLLLKKITTPVFLFILFFAVFTPLGFTLRICGKDLLGLKVGNKKSNWKITKEPGTDFTEQF